MLCSYAPGCLYREQIESQPHEVTYRVNFLALNPNSWKPPNISALRPLIIGASLSEPHTYVKYATAVCMCIYIYMYICIYVPYVVLGHGTNLCRVQNGQDGRPLRSRCVRLKYSLRTASNEKEVVRNEAYAPTSQPGKNTGIVRRNSAN